MGDTPSREELLALADQVDAALREHTQAEPCDLASAHRKLASILFGHTPVISAALRLAAKPSDEVREATIEEIAQRVFARMHPAYRYGRHEIQRLIRSLSTGEQKS